MWIGANWAGIGRAGLVGRWRWVVDGVLVRAEADMELIIVLPWLSVMKLDDRTSLLWSTTDCIELRDDRWLVPGDGVVARNNRDGLLSREPLLSKEESREISRWRVPVELPLREGEDWWWWWW